MIHQTPRVFVVDDDPGMRDSLAFMFSGTGLSVESYASAESFLKIASRETHGCLILDLRMPGMGGLELLAQLRAREVDLPVIVLTGHGDIATAVNEMKRGAFDFISKPVNREVLLRRVREACDIDLQRCVQGQEAVSIGRAVATLSPREREVMDLVAHGQSNKSIAKLLGLSARTVANHRAHILRKMTAINSADLGRKLGVIGRLANAPGAP